MSSVVSFDWRFWAALRGEADLGERKANVATLKVASADFKNDCAIVGNADAEARCAVNVQTVDCLINVMHRVCKVHLVVGFGFDEHLSIPVALRFVVSIKHAPKRVSTHKMHLFHKSALNGHKNKTP